MIGVTAARTEELLPLRVRLRGLGTIDEETERRDHQQGWQIHLAEQEICPKNRSHPFHRRRNYALIGDLPGTNMVKQEPQYRQLCIGNAGYRRQRSSRLVSHHGVFCVLLPLGIPRISPGNTHKLWRRRDSLSISFETGWTMPSSLIAYAMSRMRGVLFEPAPLES
jgi:hypothetical protein